MQLSFSRESVVIAVYALKNEYNQVWGVGGVRGLSLPFISVNFKEICCHSCVICDCIEKMKSKHFILFFCPFWGGGMFLCRYFYCKMNVMFLSDTNLV